MSADKMPPSSMLAFAKALNGKRGDLDAWLECNNEAEVRANVRAYAAEQTRELVEALACEIQRDIMNLPTSPLVEGWAPDERHNYKMGHRDARHDAVEAVLSLIAKHKEQP